MDIYCHIESDDFEQHVLPQWVLIEQAIQDWLTESRSIAKLVSDTEQKLIGLQINTNKKLSLKKPLDFLNALSQDYQLDFVLGCYDANYNAEDICYFGHEEGKANLNEIANYVGIER